MPEAMARAAANWLWMLTDEVSGNAPNLGANDGAMLLNMHSCNFRDFRPCIQLSQLLFYNRLLYAEGPWNEPLYWFRLNTEEVELVQPQRKSGLPDKAYAVLNAGQSWAMLRLPGFRFRPSQNDVFHFDLWLNGRNILCDAGSYSYVAEKDESFDFKSVHAHNTISFDGQDQMPKLGRFLMGRWIKPKQFGKIEQNPDSLSWSGSYKDSRGNTHMRKVSSAGNTWQIEDTFSGKFNTAIVGFNLDEAVVEVADNFVVTPWGRMIFEGHSSLAVNKSYCSEYYQQKRSIDRVAVLAGKNKSLITKIILEK